MTWDDYLAGMGRNGVYGDQITLNGIAALYRIKITVVATLGPDAQVSINEGEGNLECVLGNFAEGNGEHYLNLERDFEPETDDEIVEFVVTLLHLLLMLLHLLLMLLHRSSMLLHRLSKLLPSRQLEPISR